MFQMRICNHKPSVGLQTRTNKIGTKMTMGNKGRLFMHRKKTDKENHVMNAQQIAEVSKNKERQKDAQSHVRLGQNQPTTPPKKRQCNTANFITDNSMEKVYVDRLLQETSMVEWQNNMIEQENNAMNTNIHVQDKVLQSPTKQSIIDKSNQTFGQNHLGKQRKIICAKNKGNMNQNDRMQQGRNNSNAYKKQQYNTVDFMDANSLEIGTKVLLKSWKNRNKNVAITAIVSCDPTRKVGGVELGTAYLMVHIDFSLARSEELIRPYKG